MDSPQVETAAMRRALALAGSPGIPLGPNPRVGCVLLDQEGVEVAEGFHRGAGSPHAEVAALREAGDRARGATAVVTLEPCNHTGRTGPCSEALIAAGVRRVVFAQPDPNPAAQGGLQRLRAAGIEVVFGLLEDEARRLNRAWTFALEHGRPFVTWKFAATLDGYSAARDGSSRWVSGRASRVDSHRLRAECDVILVGTHTVVTDDPELTVRDEYDDPHPHQPLRAVMGTRDLDPGLRVFDTRADTVQLRTRDPREALSRLFDSGRRHVFLEGGPTLAGTFLRAGLVDETVVYVAPKLLGAGRPAVADLGLESIEQALAFVLADVTTLGTGPDKDVRLVLTPGSTARTTPGSGPGPTSAPTSGPTPTSGEMR